MENLPALCTELKIRAENGTALVNSRDVAELFKKRHADVLRDIEALKIDANLRQSWFRPLLSLDGYGREQPSVDLTRQGFSLLVMGWTGERAMQFKVRYIQAFDEMDRALSSGAAVTGSDLIQAVREIVAPLAIRFDGQDTVEVMTIYFLIIIGLAGGIDHIRMPSSAACDAAAAVINAPSPPDRAAVAYCIVQ